MTPMNRPSNNYLVQALTAENDMRKELQKFADIGCEVVGDTVIIPDKFAAGYAGSSDMGEAFHAIKQVNKAVRAKRMDNFAAHYDWFKSHPDITDVVMHSAHHWTMKINRHVLQVWPSSAKWQFQGKTCNGTIEDLKNYIMKRCK